VKRRKRRRGWDLKSENFFFEKWADFSLCFSHFSLLIFLLTSFSLGEIIMITIIFPKKKVDFTLFLIVLI